MSFSHLETKVGSGDLSASVTFDTTPSQGELLVVSLFVTNLSDLSSVQPPEGFQLSASRLESFRTLAVYTKISQGTESSIAFTNDPNGTERIGIIARRFSTMGGVVVSDTVSASATNSTQITVGPALAEAGSLVIAVAMNGAFLSSTWSGSFIGQQGTSVSNYQVDSTYKISGGGNESTTRTLEAQETRQSALMVVFSEAGPQLSITDPLIPGTATSVRPDGFVDPPTGARITDGTSTIEIAYNSENDTVTPPALGAQSYVLFGDVTLELYNAEESATTSATFNPPAAYEFLVTLPATPSNLTNTGYLFNWSPDNGYEDVQVISPFEIDANGNIVLAPSDGVYTLYSIDDFDGEMQGFTVTIQDGEVVSVGRLTRRNLTRRTFTRRSLTARP